MTDKEIKERIKKLILEYAVSDAGISAHEIDNEEFVLNYIIELARNESFSDQNTLKQLREINRRRCKFFGHDLNDWDMPRWGNAVAGEVGEMCNIIKKIDRGNDYKTPFALQVANQSLSYEIADVVIYLDLLAQRAGINLADAIKEKFNKVSKELTKDYTVSQAESFFIK